MDLSSFLIADVSRLLRRSFDDRARQIGVTRAQWRALTALSRQEGINQSGLAELLEVEPITLCRMVDRLEEAGHVERRRDPDDRRAWRIHLTEKSRPLLARLRVIGDELFETALAGVDDRDRAVLNDALARIRLNLTSLPQKDDASHG